MDEGRGDGYCYYVLNDKLDILGRVLVISSYFKRNVQALELFGQMKYSAICLGLSRTLKISEPIKKITNRFSKTVPHAKWTKTRIFLCILLLTAKCSCQVHNL